VAVSADHHVGHNPEHPVAVLGRDDRRQLFEVDGVHDAGARRMNPHAAQRLGCPTKEAVPLTVSPEFMIEIDAQCIRPCERLHSQRVVD
jgi:hypothetical protein